MFTVERDVREGHENDWDFPTQLLNFDNDTEYKPLLTDDEQEYNKALQLIFKYLATAPYNLANWLLLMTNSGNGFMTQHGFNDMAEVIQNNNPERYLIHNLNHEGPLGEEEITYWFRSQLLRANNSPWLAFQSKDGFISSPERIEPYVTSPEANILQRNIARGLAQHGKIQAKLPLGLNQGTLPDLASSISDICVDARYTPRASVLEQIAWTNERYSLSPENFCQLRGAPELKSSLFSSRYQFSKPVWQNEHQGHLWFPHGVRPVEFKTRWTLASSKLLNNYNTYHTPRASIYPNSLDEIQFENKKDWCLVWYSRYFDRGLEQPFSVNLEDSLDLFTDNFFQNEKGKWPSLSPEMKRDFMSGFHFFNIVVPLHLGKHGPTEDTFLSFSLLNAEPSFSGEHQNYFQFERLHYPVNRTSDYLEGHNLKPYRATQTDKQLPVIAPNRWSGESEINKWRPRHNYLVEMWVAGQRSNSSNLGIFNWSSI